MFFLCFLFGTAIHVSCFVFLFCIQLMPFASAKWNWKARTVFMHRALCVIAQHLHLLSFKIQRATWRVYLGHRTRKTLCRVRGVNNALEVIESYAKTIHGLLLRHVNYCFFFFDGHIRATWLNDSANMKPSNCRFVLEQEILKFKHHVFVIFSPWHHHRLHTERHKLINMFLWSFVWR